jgi:hypothetical protein
LIVPRNGHPADLPVSPGDAVTSIDGEVVGRVGAVTTSEFQVVTPAGSFWLSRDDVFLSDNQGVALAYGIEELPEHTLYHAEEVA